MNEKVKVADEAESKAVKVWVFRCSRTGMLYPSDYVEEWGKKYGIGLGPIPISEALVNNYQSPPIAGDIGDSMHPVGNCHSQVDLVQVTQAEFDAKRAILQADDPRMHSRAAAMKKRQMVHSRAMKSLYPTASL